jgi:hypothetical protein
MRRNRKVSAIRTSIILKEQTSKEMDVPGDWVVIAKLQA